MAPTGTRPAALPRSRETFAQPRWGYQTGLWQPRQPSFWFYLIALLLGGVLILFAQLVFLFSSPAGWVVTWVLLVLFALPVAVALRWLDLYEREPASLLLGALLWGGLAATTFSVLASPGWDEVVLRLLGPEAAAEWGPALTAPVIEELYKYLGVVFIYLIARREIDDLLDGFVYGAMVGLGFTLVEDALYFHTVFGGSVPDVLFGFYYRTIAGGIYGHLLYTGIAGLGLAYFVTRRGEVPTGRRFVVAVAMLVLAIFAHFLWNSPLLPIEGPEWLTIWAYHAIKSVPFLILAGVAIRLARRRERRWLREALASEVGRSGLMAEELEALAEPRRRRAVRNQMGQMSGRDAARALAELQREQVNLAMARSRVGRHEHPELLRQRALCRMLRERLLAYPGAMAALGLSAESVARLAALLPEPALAYGFAPDAQLGTFGAYAYPSPAADPRFAIPVPPGMPVAVLDREGPFARIVAPNGWLAWIDAGALAPLAAPVAGPG